MIVRICAFTSNGDKLAERIARLFPDDIVEIRDKNVPLETWSRETFVSKSVAVFVGACGIAVRSVARSLRDKLTDSPVVVVDETAKFAIPILSGHLGGANDFARKIAKGLDAIPVVTTATDANGLFAVDVFAKKNDLRICERAGIGKISSLVLSGKRATVAVEPEIKFDPDKVPKELELVPYPPKRRVDIVIGQNPATDPLATLRLAPKNIAFGIGCKRGTPFERLDKLVEQAFGGAELESLWQAAFAVASVDLKKKERGLVEFAQRHNVPLRTFSAEQLKEAQGEFSRSEFVLGTVGVDNVCERAAALCAGRNAVLFVKKTIGEGATFAAAMKKDFVIKSWTV